MAGQARWPIALLAGLALSGLAAGAAGAAVGDCVRWRRAFADMPTGPLQVIADSRRLVLPVKVAGTAEQQAAGFQCATPREIQQTLILFDFGQEILTQFHMRHVPAPLDIAFAKADGRIFAILRMDPSDTALYGPMGPFRYAVEARVGFFADHEIRQGEARLVVTPRP